jgi:pyridoxal 5'-phosphate synthase pdxS subunit
VQATTHYLDADLVARVSEDLGEAMVGIDISRLEPGELLQTRGW